MRKLTTLLSMLPLALCLSIPAIAASANAQKSSSSKEHIYYGDISDSNCGAHHKMAGNPEACAKACIKNGASYVFVTRGKVLNIANQDAPDLSKYAGDHVRVTGSRQDNTITIASIRQARRRSSSKKAGM